MCDPTFLGIASRFFPVATVMTELSGGFPKSDTLSTQHERTVSVTHRAQTHSAILEYFNVCEYVCPYLSSGQLKQDSQRMSVVFIGGGS